MKKKKLLMIPLAVLLMSSLFSCRGNDISSSSKSDVSESTNNGQSSSGENTHSHSYATNWSNDETYHWHDATCGHNVRSDEEEHNYSEWVVITEATEDTKGSKKRTCTVCGYEETVEISESEHTHTIVKVKKVDATCTEDGVKAHYECTTCGKVFKDEDGENETTLKALRIKASHSLVHHDEVLETSDSDGLREYWSCSDCGKYFSNSEATNEITDKTSLVIKTFSKGLSYDQQDGGYVVSGLGICEDTDIVIPSTYNGLKVTKIADYAFDSSKNDKCKNITSIVIPEGVTEIGMCTFNQCENLKTVVIPQSLTNICKYAFNKCNNLESVYYKGSLSDWSNVTIGIDNGKLKDVTLYYSETVPTDGDHSYWHYDTNGNITVWTVYKVARLDATCTENGHEEYYKSTTSDTYYTDETGTKETTLDALKISALGHKLTHHEAKDATKAKDGNIEYWECSICGKYYKDSNGDTEITDKTSVIVKYYSKGLTYSFDNTTQTYSVSIGSCSDTDIVIPSTYNDGENGIHNVTGILNNAFYQNTNIESVRIPEGVTTIGTNAFNGCTNLKSVVIPEGVTTIGDNTFGFCTNLTSIVIPESVTSINYRAFQNCTSLTVYYKGTNEKWSNITINNEGGNNSCLVNATRYYYSESVPTDNNFSYWHYDSDGNITVWTVYKVAKVEASCEDGHEEYYKSTTSDKLYKDEAGTIETTLEALTIKGTGHNLVHHAATDATINKDGNKEYWECSKCGKYYEDAAGTKEITDKNSVIIYYYSSGLNFTYDSATQTYSVSIGSCSDADIVIPSTYNDGENGIHNVTIANSAFKNTNIKSVIILEGVTIIGEWAFGGCTNLEKVEIPSSVTTIGSHAFEGPRTTNKITSITIPDGITEIKECTFAYLSNLKEIVLPDSVTSIGTNAFLDGGLDVIYYKGTPEKFEKITVGSVSGGGANCFNTATRYYYSETKPTDSNNYWYYDKDGNIQIWQSEGLVYEFNSTSNTYTVSSIGTCSEKELIIPSRYKGYKVTSIEEDAFNANEYITSVIICDGIVSIGFAAFASSPLTSVVLGSSIKTIGEYAFSNCYNLKTVYIPSSVERIESDAFGYSDLLTQTDVMPTIKYAGTEEKWKQICSDYEKYTDITYNCTK